jgi:hypothetical protein
MSRIIRYVPIICTALLFSGLALATSVPSLSFNELTDRSEMIVSGHVTRSWSEWDTEHKFIWTHHEVAISGVHKGGSAATVVVSEPGGIVGNRGMNIAGAVAYYPGDNVVVFAQRMPNGYLRTTGWGQGKYLVDGSGHLHADASLETIERVDAATPATGLQLRSLDGMTVTELKTRIAARLRGSLTAGRAQ